MPGAFSPIFPPPQSIDSLDFWGSLDGLPFSLDSSLWTTAGLYGLTVSDAVTIGQQADGQRTRTSVLAGLSVADGQAAGQAVLELRGEDAASGGGEAAASIAVWILLDAVSSTAGESLTLERVRPLLVDASVSSHAGADFQRIRSDAHASRSEVVATLVAVRVRPGSGTDVAQAAQEGGFERIRLHSGVGEGHAEAAVIGGVTVSIPLDVSAGMTFQAMAEAVRIRTDAVALPGASREWMLGGRLRSDVLGVSARSGGEADVWRVLMLLGDGVVVTDGRALPEYKGWGWDADLQAGQEWAPLVHMPKDWQAMGGKDATWRLLVTPVGGWKKVRSEAQENWRGIVEWQ